VISLEKTVRGREIFGPGYMPGRQEKITAHINRPDLIRKRVCWEENERTETDVLFAKLDSRVQF